jgi:glycosyltransferase involved in cell wall biosynthesis
VLKAVVKHPLINEIIVVDDGSQDDTAAVASSFKGVRVISIKPNKGKSNAVAQGIISSKQEFIMMLDADLVGLTAEDVTALAEPVLSGRAGCSMSLRSNSFKLFHAFGIDFVSGERVFPRSMIQDPSEISKLRYFGLESYLNNKIIEKHLKIAVVKWLNVSHTRKHDKNQTMIEGWKGEISMVKDIICTIGLTGPIRQVIQLKKQLTR